MTENALVGYSGLVGSNLQQFYEFKYFYNSKNFKDAIGKTFDTLFFCGLPAVKWYTNKNPNEDDEIINKIKEILNTISVKRFILISTIDVYENINNEYNEDYEIKYYNNHTYGKNRFLFEEYIKNNFANYNIIRLCGLFGKGLKKNIIYDLINNNNINNIPLNSSFQWYYLDWLKKDIELILNNNIKICNLFTEPIDTLKIIETFNDVYKKDYKFQIEYLGNIDTKITYNTCTKYFKIFNTNNKYIRCKEEILNGLLEYLNFEKLNRTF
jgi:nucleoside-diphosphate-sugar epimerase